MAPSPATQRHQTGPTGYRVSLRPFRKIRLKTGEGKIGPVRFLLDSLFFPTNHSPSLSFPMGQLCPDHFIQKENPTLVGRPAARDRPQKGERSKCRYLPKTMELAPRFFILLLRRRSRRAFSRDRRGDGGRPSAATSWLFDTQADANVWAPQNGLWVNVIGEWLSSVAVGGIAICQAVSLHQGKFGATNEPGPPRESAISACCTLFESSQNKQLTEVPSAQLQLGPCKIDGPDIIDHG